MSDVSGEIETAEREQIEQYDFQVRVDGVALVAQSLLEELENAETPGFASAYLGLHFLHKSQYREDPAAPFRVRGISAFVTGTVEVDRSNPDWVLVAVASAIGRAEELSVDRWSNNIGYPGAEETDRYAAMALSGRPGASGTDHIVGFEATAWQVYNYDGLNETGTRDEL